MNQQYALVAVSVIVAAAMAVVSFIAGFISSNNFAKSRDDDDGGEVIRRCDDCGAKWPPEEWPPDDGEACEECGSSDIRTWYRLS